MADFTAVGLGAQQPDFLGKLSTLLSIQGQKQALQGQAAEVAGAQQTQRQRAALANYDWNKHIGEDGTFDLNSLNDPELMHAAGDKYLDVVTHAVQAKQQQLESKKTLLGLRNDQRSAFSEMLGALRSDKDVAEDNDKGRQKVNQAMLQYGQMYGDDVLPVLSAYAAPLQKAPKGRMSDALRAIQLQAHSASQQLTAQAPDYTNTGAELTNINPNAAPGAAPNSIPLSIAPGFHVVTDPRTNNPYLINQQTGEVRDMGYGYPGGSIGTKAPPNTPTKAGAQPPASLPKPYYAGQAGDVEHAQTEVRQVRQAGDQAPLNRNINQQILTLSRDTRTGPGSSTWQHAMATLGLGTIGDDYQELGKYLEKNALNAMSAMGGPASDARLDAAVKANGSTDFNPGALQDVTKFNDATNTALIKYRQGIDQAVGTRNADYTRYNDFRGQWAKNFDVNIYRYENAVRDGDEAEIAKIEKEEGKKGMAELLKKRRNLESLSQNGELPK